MKLKLKISERSRRSSKAEIDQSDEKVEFLSVCISDSFEWTWKRWKWEKKEKVLFFGEKEKEKQANWSNDAKPNGWKKSSERRSTKLGKRNFSNRSEFFGREVESEKVASVGRCFVKVEFGFRFSPNEDFSSCRKIENFLFLKNRWTCGNLVRRGKISSILILIRTFTDRRRSPSRNPVCLRYQRSSTKPNRKKSLKFVDAKFDKPKTFGLRPNFVSSFQIYALNQLMKQLEQEQFRRYCQTHGLTIENAEKLLVWTFDKLSIRFLVQPTRKCSSFVSLRSVRLDRLSEQISSTRNRTSFHFHRAENKPIESDGENVAPSNEDFLFDKNQFYLFLTFFLSSRSTFYQLLLSFLTEFSRSNRRFSFRRAKILVEFILENEIFHQFKLKKRFLDRKVLFLFRLLFFLGRSVPIGRIEKLNCFSVSPVRR